MVGKWHLCPDDEMNLASTRRNWPSGRGFERWYGFLGAETSQWYPDLVYDNHLVDQPKTPEEGYHLTVDLTDKAIEFIMDAKAVAPEKPFFLYYAPGACHAPHHAPKEWIDKYKGQFDMGYEAMREQTLARQKELGIVPADTELPPINPIGTTERTGPDGKPFPALDVTRPWDSLSDDEKRLFCRMAEVYAGFLAHADDQIGRLLGFLEEFGWRENTLVVLVSDNGASGEGGPNGSVNEMKFANGIPDTIEANLPLLDELGGTKTYNHYPNGWAMAFNTPFKMWKRYEFNGGTSDPCIISWPAGHEGRRARSASSTTTRSTSSRPSSTRSASRRRERSRATSRAPSTASACAPASTTATAPTTRTTQFYSMLGSRAIWHDGWKAVTNHPTIAGWSHFNDDEWELYHTDVDRSELHNLAAEQPEKVRELVNLWYAEAGANGAFPLDDRSALEIMLTPRPVLSPPRDRYVYFPGHGRGARVAGGQRPQPLVRDRRAGRHPRARRRRRAVRARLAVRRPRALRQGQPAALRLQLRRHVRAEDRRDRGPSHRREPDPVGVVRQGGRGPAGRRHRDALALARRRRRSARARSRPSPASS